jgi:hypothetical protein
VRESEHDHVSRKQVESEFQPVRQQSRPRARLVVFSYDVGH